MACPGLAGENKRIFGSCFVKRQPITGWSRLVFFFPFALYTPFIRGKTARVLCLSFDVHYLYQPGVLQQNAYNFFSRLACQKKIKNVFRHYIEFYNHFAMFLSVTHH